MTRRCGFVTRCSRSARTTEAVCVIFHLRESGDIVLAEEERELPDIAAIEAAARMNAH
jgi:hypothetical protein